VAPTPTSGLTGKVVGSQQVLGPSRVSTARRWRRAGGAGGAPEATPRRSASGLARRVDRRMRAKPSGVGIAQCPDWRYV
jgi:hypothetical protein